MVAPEKKIFLIVQRNEFQRDIKLMSRFTEHFTTMGYTVIGYEPIPAGLRVKINRNGRFRNLPRPIRALISFFTLLSTPRLWRYAFRRLKDKNLVILERAQALKTYIQGFGSGVKVLVLARSAGARIASMIVDEIDIKLICVGYPFKHPDKPNEVARYRHLQSVSTPMLILQGTDDIYGGREILTKYKLSPQIDVKFIETTHDFDITSDQLNTVLKYTADFTSDWFANLK